MLTYAHDCSFDHLNSIGQVREVWHNTAILSDNFQSILKKLHLQLIVGPWFASRLKVVEPAEQLVPMGGDGELPDKGASQRWS